MGFFDILKTWWDADFLPADPPKVSGTLVQEGLFDGVSGDPDAAHSAAQIGAAYSRKLSQSVRDLPMLTQDRAREIAWWLYETNPYAKRLVELVRDYVIADGCTVTVPKDAEDVERTDAVGGELGTDAAPETPPEQEVIDRFWSDPFNRMDTRLDALVLELGLFGEQFVTVGVNPANGAVRLGSIDPGSVSQVIHDPRQPDQPAVVIVSGAVGRPGIIGADQQVFKVVRVDDDASSPTYGRVVGVRTRTDGTPMDRYASGPDAQPQDYAGSVMVWAVNKVSTATRGRSDLLTLADWIDALDQVLFGEVDRQLLMKNFIWDVTLTGADSGFILDWLKQNGSAPKPGTIRAHNEKVAWQAVSPDLNTYDTSGAVDLFRDMLAVGSGLPKVWLSGTTDVNRSTASEMSEPAFKRLTMRQRVVRTFLSDLVRFVLDQAELAGRLPMRQAARGTLPTPWRFDVTMPEIRPKDLALAASTFAAVVPALAAARADDAIDQEVQQQVLKLLVEQLGVSVDLDAMRERIEADKEARQTDMAMMRPPMPPMDTPADPMATQGGHGGPMNGNGQTDGQTPDVSGMATLARGPVR